MWVPLHGRTARLPEAYQAKNNRAVLGRKMDLEGSRKILKVNHVSVINWVKKAGAKLEKVPKKDEKVDVLELEIGRAHV